MRNATRRRVYVDHDFQGIVPDGGVVRSSVMLMDARRFAFDAENHMPGYRHVSDAAVQVHKLPHVTPARR
jgi:hypothetical protein